ncbi:hypothetical protein C8R43DRAFT_1127241 [Mycena crocata]|nr:hypothetical protein C8R43DRAFT_1127241 [Mycena crocata]
MASNKTLRPLPDLADSDDNIPALIKSVDVFPETTAQMDGVESDDESDCDDMPGLESVPPSDDELPDFAEPAPLGNPFAVVPRRRRVAAKLPVAELQKGEAIQDYKYYVSDNKYTAAAKATAAAIVSYDVACQYAPNWHRDIYDGERVETYWEACTPCRACPEPDTLPDASADAKLVPVRSKL